MPKPLTGRKLIDYLLDRDDYDLVIKKFNSCTHSEKFEALADPTFRGYLNRATAYAGSITAGFLSKENN